MAATSQINDFVLDALDSADVELTTGADDVCVLRFGNEEIGQGRTVHLAVLDALARGSSVARLRAQSLLLAATMSFGPDAVWEAITELWSDDLEAYIESEDDAEDDEDEDDD